jgi:hypothetical protein
VICLQLQPRSPAAWRGWAPGADARRPPGGGRDPDCAVRSWRDDLLVGTSRCDLMAQALTSRRASDVRWCRSDIRGQTAEARFGFGPPVRRRQVVGVALVADANLAAVAVTCECSQIRPIVP